ncbi:RNA polymerase II-associated [Kockovaella imperatae]|uniref:RNA polymerase II-associated n=1 Tax=Kockovaella imperatae TaxID=4999 RepID=A0A1Y1ULV1_9TREE|nr:RNA polymerase II-associated [Kockovaella imperatae]ORX38474.1 RNA polymerase II-associated [Kockovaella imperatae]
MASKKSRLDLLLRVRYLNPIPQPPFPPKLFNLSTNVNRLGEPSYLDDLVSSTPLPMLVDSEMGMPVDLNVYERVWNGNDEELGLAETQDLAAEDLALIAPFEDVKPQINGSGSAAGSTDVTWMRNSALFTRKAVSGSKSLTAIAKDEEVDASTAAQIMSIEQTFSEFDSQDVTQLKHPDPKRSRLRVVEQYEILPEDEAWSNSYIMMRYPERPTASTSANPHAEASSSRLNRAVLRPVMEDDQQIMQFLLPEEDTLPRLEHSFVDPIGNESYEQMKELTMNDPNDPQIDSVFPSALYDQIRTYEVVSQTRPQKEVLITIVEAGDPAKAQGAYYKEIGTRAQLRKTRAKRQGEGDETQEPLWDKSRVGFRHPHEDLISQRATAQAMVSDPGWIEAQLRGLGDGDNEAVGQGEAIKEDD